MRASSQSTSSAAWRLVSLAENLQPALPVQATSPPRSARGAPIEAKRGDGCQRIVERRIGNVADQQVLPHGQAQRAGAEALGDRRRGRASCPPVHARLRHDDANIVQPRLLLPVHADMAVLVLRRPRHASRPDRRAAAACRGTPPSPRGMRGTPQRSSTYFSRALVRSVRSPSAMNTRSTASADARRVVRPAR